MRKRIVESGNHHVTAGEWLDVTRLAIAEVTSEDPSFPIESALMAGGSSGWRAADAGPQTIRLLFDEPQTIRRILLEFEERDQRRTQEFVLSWRQSGGPEAREIVRQQYNFSPEGSTREVEDYRFNLIDATALELRVVPNISGGPSRASLWRMLLQ